MFSPDCVIVLPASEISIKSDAVRKFMIKRLKKNMASFFEHFGVNYSRMEFLSGRIIVYSSEPGKIVSSLAYCFGINLMFLAQEKEFSSLSDLCNEGVCICDGIISEGSFAVRGKSFCKSFSSKKLEEELGGVLIEKYPKLKVNLKGPDKEVFCVAKENKAFFYFKEISGAKGMPIGSQGKAAILIPKNSKKNVGEVEKIALNLMKSGCPICFVCEENNNLVFLNIEKYNSFKKINVFSIEAALSRYKQGRIAAFFSIAKTVKDANKDSDLVGVKVFAPLLVGFD